MSNLYQNLINSIILFKFLLFQNASILITSIETFIHRWCIIFTFLMSLIITTVCKRLEKFLLTFILSWYILSPIIMSWRKINSAWSVKWWCCIGCRYMATFFTLFSLWINHDLKFLLSCPNRLVSIPWWLLSLSIYLLTFALPVRILRF